MTDVIESIGLYIPMKYEYPGVSGLTPSPGPNVLLLSFMVGTNHLLWLVGKGINTLVLLIKNVGLNHVKNEPKIPHFNPHVSGRRRSPTKSIPDRETAVRRIFFGFRCFQYKN